MIPAPTSRSWRTLAFASAMAISLPMSAASTEPPAKTPLRSTVFSWDALTARPTPNGERRDVTNQPTPTLAVLECHVTTLNPGRASHEPHRHAQEELILLKEGTLEVHLNGATQRAGAGSAFFYASNDAHAVRNVGDTRATYWVINLATGATHDPSKHNATPTLRSGIYDWSKLKVDPTKTGERRAIMKGSTVTMKDFSVHATTVKAGEASHAPHRHPDDELVVVKDGTLEVTIEGKPHRAPAGSVLFFSSNELHGMRNAGDSAATYYVVRMITDATPKAAK